MELTLRKQRVLCEIVSEYIKTGEPVGSKSIADAIGVSSATVRNEMVELIEMNLLEQPHTSAGRRPTQAGYREFIDNLMRPAKMREDEKKYFDSMINSAAYDPERLLTCVSRVLTGVVKGAPMVTSPSADTAHIKAVQFVQTSRRTAMLVLMSSAGTMKTQVFHCEFDLNPEMMRVFFRVFNEKVAGIPVSEITPAFIQNMAVALGELSVLASSALMALLKVAADTTESELYVSGQTNLLFNPETDPITASRIIEFLDQKDEVAVLLKQRAGRVTVLLGSETGRRELSRSALIVSRYTGENKDAGAIAVLGPMRMDYARAAQILSYLSFQVSQMLTVLMREE